MRKRSKEIIDLFNLKANEYEEWYFTDEGSLVLNAEIRGLDRLLPKEGIGIEIGGGTGIFSKLLTTANRSIICLDPSIKMLKHAKNKGLQTILGLAEKTPLKNSCLDFAFMVTSLEFVQNPLNTLSSVNSILKGRGVLVILIINRESSWAEYYKSLGEDQAPLLSRANFFTFNEVLELLKKVGFKFLSALATLIKPPKNRSSENFELYSDYKEYSKAGVFIIKARK